MIVYARRRRNRESVSALSFEPYRLPRMRYALHDSTPATTGPGPSLAVVAITPRIDGAGHSARLCVGDMRRLVEEQRYALKSL
jgi:hypothetical protein